MGDERLEDLVRGMAKAQSRREMLKTLGAGLLVGVTGLLVPRAFAAPRSGCSQCADDAKAFLNLCLNGCGVGGGETRICKRQCRADYRLYLETICNAENCPTGKICCGSQCVDPCAPCFACDPATSVCKSTCGDIPCAACYVPPGTSTGLCTAPQLESWQACCSGTIVNLTSDPHNCGSCGYTCASDQTCFNATCYSCISGETACNNTCVNLLTDSANCGSCGHACADGYFCSNGVCTSVTSICPQPDQGGAAYYVYYPCGSVQCNCQMDVCVSGVCRKWCGPNPTLYPPKVTDGYCPAEAPYRFVAPGDTSGNSFKCCDYYGANCICPSGINSAMGTDGYCHPV